MHRMSSDVTHLSAGTRRRRECSESVCVRAGSTRGINCCTACTPGFYKNGTGNERCEECPVGKFSPENLGSAADACIECGTGTYARKTGMSPCVLCPQGSFQRHGRLRTVYVRNTFCAARHDRVCELRRRNVCYDPINDMRRLHRRKVCAGAKDDSLPVVHQRIRSGGLASSKVVAC
jgi:hypothetical protein